jgi:hypothetical protein
LLHSWLHIGIPLCSEYPALLSPNLESERVYKPYIIASDTEVSKNYKFINEDGGVIDSSIQRSADDYSIWDVRLLTSHSQTVLREIGQLKDHLKDLRVWIITTR